MKYQASSKKRKTGQSLNVISLFSGAMGFDIGLERAGLKVAIAQDINEWCCETIRKNGHRCVEGDLRELLKEDPKFDFLLKASGLRRDQIFAVVGGPPCQAFSTAGKRKGINDERGGLVSQFQAVVRALRPRFFVMENVKGIASMPIDPKDKKSGLLLDLVLKEFREMKYKVVAGLLDAVHYGTPQFRERLVVIGSRDDEDIFLPIPTHYHQHQDPDKRWRTLSDCIGKGYANGQCAKFTKRIQQFLVKVPEGGNWKTLSAKDQKEAMGGAFLSGGGKVGFYRRLSFSEPSPTLVTSPIQKATILCHPKDTRPLSVYEYARIQGFPETWVIEGNASECYKQIGNAVPVPLGEAIGKMLISVAKQESKVRVKRLRGTSVHKKLDVFGAAG